MGETAVVKSIVNYIKRIGGKAIKTHGDAFSVVGTPDILACINGDFWAIEAKYGDNEPTPAQKHQLKLWKQAGAKTLVAWSLADMKAAIARAYKERDGEL